MFSAEKVVISVFFNLLNPPYQGDFKRKCVSSTIIVKPTINYTPIKGEVTNLTSGGAPLFLDRL